MSITRSQIARQMYADGALVDPRMANTLEQNKAINNANAQINQAMRSSGGLKSLYDQYGISDADRSRLSGGMASRNMILQNSHREELVKQLAGLQNQNVVYSSYRPPKPPTDMFGILISDHNKYGVGSDPTKVSETDMNAFRQRVLDAQKNYYQKELDLINQDYISSGYPDQARTLEEYMRSIGAYAKGGRAGYAYGGRGYSDYASPSSTTASQDFATQAVSGGQTNYDGGGGSYDYIPQPPMTKVDTARLQDLNNRFRRFDKEKAKNFIIGAADGFARATVFPYNVVRSAQGISSVLNKAGLIDRDYLALENLIKQQQTGFNPNASPTSDTAGLTYGQMRTGGTFDITNTGGDNQPIIPRFPIIAQAPTDVESTPSDFDLYAALEGREAMRFGENPLGIMGAAQRFSEGGEVRQAYGLGKLVKKITKPIQKVVKSDLGKAALTAAAAYYAPALLGKSGYISGANPLFSATGKGGITDFLVKKGLGAKDYLRNLTGIGLAPGAKSTMSPTKRILTGLGIGATVSPFFMGGEEEDEETLDQAITRAYGKSDLDIPGIRRAALGYSDPNELYFKLPSAYRLNAADGGIMKSFESVKNLENNKNTEIAKGPSRRRLLQIWNDSEIERELGPGKDYTTDELENILFKLHGGMIYMAEGGITSIDVDDLPMSKEGSPKYYNPEGEEISFKEFEEAMKKEKQIMPKKKPSRTKKAEGGIASEDKVKMLIKRGADNDLIKTYVEGISDSEIEQIRNMMRADKAEGGLMNLGGNEMDLRGGGFVPIGAKEKADDVPARLSKNEFVFTADAVRAAGGGSIENGAQKMYNTMKQLEKMV